MIAGLIAATAAAAPKKKSPAPPAAAADASPAAPKKLAEGVWAMMTKGGANAGWFTFGDSVVAVDAGRSVSDAEAILAEIARTTGKKTVAYLILTNDFGPHAGGAAAFVRAGATIVTHDTFLGGLQGFAASSARKGSVPPLFGIDSRLALARPERHVVIRHLGPADSAGDIAVLLAEDKIVFTGDLAESYLLPPLFSKTIDPDGWIAALGTLSSLHPVAVVPGYGPIGPPEAIAVTREYLTRTLEIARKIVEDKTPDSAIEMRLNEPDMAIAGLPEELKRSHQANVKALVAWLRTPKAAPRK
jgi:glyoxylase-like metal-dependent hydrolase (beta-lactamase superfamily II)